MMILDFKTKNHEQSNLRVATITCCTKMKAKEIVRH